MATLSLTRLVGHLRQSLAAAQWNELSDRDLLDRFLARDPVLSRAG